MAIVGRARTATGAGVFATALLVLLFGNQAFTEWVVRHTDGNTVWGWFLRTLSWPAWTVRSTIPIRDLLAQDLRAVLLVVFVALVLGSASRAVTGGGFLLGWAALIFGSALAAFATAFLATHSSWLGAFEAAGDGSRYGLFVGWIVGLAVASTKARVAARA
ncbi:MAG: hypothetical protein E6F99_17020 [Actinobacteria bacterium]|nr:MAG: hypothetical protein E6F99_17020 [Actinomycetota bacterium]